MSGGIRASQRRILVVDDEEIVVSMLQCALALEGVHVVGASSEDQGRQLLRDGAFDLACIDMRLRRTVADDCSGLILLADMAPRRPDVPMVLISAYLAADESVQAMDAGAFATLPKPFRPAHILTLLEQASARKAARAESHHDLVPPVAEKVARWVWLASATEEVHSREELAAGTHVTVGTFCRWCGRLRLGAGTVSRLARALWAVRAFHGSTTDVEAAFEIADDAALSTFLAKAGLQPSAAWPAIDEFLRCQTFVPADHPLVVALRALARSN